MVQTRYKFKRVLAILLSGEPSGLLKVVKEGKRWDLIQIQMRSHLFPKHSHDVAFTIGEMNVHVRRSTRVLVEANGPNCGFQLYVW